MKPTPEHIAQIRTAFEKMQTREDLLILLNNVKPLVYGNKAVPFELKQLTWYANPKRGRKRYIEFKVKKKNGAERKIHSPVKGLKSLQKTIGFILQCVYEPHKAAMGFVRDKSIVDNARLHEGNRYVYNIDLKDFFPSIDQARVWKCLQLKPFNLVDRPENEKQEPKKLKTGIRIFVTSFGEHIYYKFEDGLTLVVDQNGNFNRYKNRISANISEPEINTAGTLLEQLRNVSDHQEKVNRLLFEDAIKYITTDENIKVLKILIPARIGIANILASICCTEVEVERKNEAGEWETVKRNVLPQGAPTSPVITNIVCQRLDYLLSAVAKRFGLKYSRYADDITFSSMHNVYQPDGDFLTELHRIIADQGFHIKESKTRLQKDGYRKEVTGLLVNEKANVQQRYIKQLRMWLYYWERYGYERASGFFLQEYLAEKGHVKKGKPDMANVIAGKLDYLKMVKGVDNELYLKLKDRFDILTFKTSGKEVFNPPALKINYEKRAELFKLLGFEPKNKIQDSNLSDEGLEVSPKKYDSNNKNLKELETIQIKIPIVHNPMVLVGLLSKFSENSHPLKYACHSWEDGRVDDLFQDYSDFIKKFDEVGKSVCFEIQKLKKSLGTKILHFLNTINEEGKYYLKDQFANYYWGEFRMRYGWKSKELSNWAKENPAIDPFEFPLPIKSIISKRNRDIEISKFGDVIRIFKDEIEIRPEESALYNLFADLRRKYLGLDFRVVINDSLKGKQFYTDVHDFKRALNKIFREISVRTIHPNVSISANNFPEDGYTIIEILHHESYCVEKSSEEITKEIYDGDFADIIKYLENLCDWSIESKFNDGSFRINYLSSSITDLPKRAIDNAVGFKHIFKFYKT